MLLAALLPVCSLAQEPAEESPERPASQSSAAGPDPRALPWELQPRVGEPVLRPPSGAKEILARYDISDSQLENFFSGQPLGPSEEDVLVKILFRFPRVGLDNVARWRRKDVTWDQVAAAPAEFRTEIFRLQGRATLVERVELLPELVELYEFTEYFRVTIDLDDSPYAALVCCRSVPQAWKIGKPIDERAAADGLFLKLGDKSAANPPLIFAAERASWLPDRADSSLHLGRSQIELARRGVDWGLFDLVREANGKGILDTDREAFYQVLHAFGRDDAGKMGAENQAPVDVVPLLERPEEHHGEIFALRGTARRIMKVPVRDADIQSRFGIDHYYEIDLFLPLGDKNLKLGKLADDPVYRNGFPATLIVRSLPEGLSEGERLFEIVEADAAFFKIWSYRSNYAGKFGKVQPAPLFIAGQPRIVTVERESNVVVSVLVASAFALAIGIVIVVMWWFRRSDAAFEAGRRGVRAGEAAAPDFSRFAE